MLNFSSLSATRSSSITHTIPTPSPSPSKPLSTIPLSVAFSVVVIDQNEREISSLSTAEAVVTTAVVCGVCSFTAGLLLGVLLTQCHGHCHRKQKRGQTEIPPVYEDITLEKTPPAIELHNNDAIDIH